MDEEGDAWRDLVAEVKKRQRSGEAQRLQWHRYCDMESGPRDPKRHSLQSLRAFLELAAEGRLDGEEEPHETAAPPPAAPRSPAAPEVPEEELRAARARAAATDGAGVWELLPRPWQAVYAGPARLRYDASRYDFVAMVREMLECPPDLPLSRLHEAERSEDFEPCPPLRQGMLLAGLPVPPEKKLGKSKTRAKRDWKGSQLYEDFLALYSRFLQEEVLPQLARAVGDDAPFEAVAQSSPVLRVVMPSQHFATVPHRDCEYGHVPEELNYWMPLTEVWGSNSLFAESFPGREDYEPFVGGSGDLFRWWGNRCSHFAEANATGSTRVSLDFRIVPKGFWDAAEAAETLHQAAEGWTRWHGGSLRLGSYYYLERAGPLP